MTSDMKYREDQLPSETATIHSNLPLQSLQAIRRDPCGNQLQSYEIKLGMILRRGTRAGETVFIRQAINVETENERGK